MRCMSEVVRIVVIVHLSKLVWKAKFFIRCVMQHFWWGGSARGNLKFTTPGSESRVKIIRKCRCRRKPLNSCWFFFYNSWSRHGWEGSLGWLLSLTRTKKRIYTNSFSLEFDWPGTTGANRSGISQSSLHFLRSFLEVKTPFATSFGIVVSAIAPL